MSKRKHNIMSSKPYDSSLEIPIKKRIISREIHGITPSIKPHLIIMGPPGIGKSSYLKKNKKLMENTVLINRDSLIEDSEFQELQKTEKQKWIVAHKYRSELKNMAKKREYRMCFDITGLNISQISEVTKICDEQKRKLDIIILLPQYKQKLETDIETISKKDNFDINVCLQRNKMRKRQVKEKDIIKAFPKVIYNTINLLSNQYFKRKKIEHIKGKISVIYN